jgi:hypothetical protein
MDNMIEYMNKVHGDRYEFRYSTPSDYVDAVSKHDVKWPTKYDDMFPYSDNPYAYWTGYFTARPNDKEQIRRASSWFHASSQLFSQQPIQGPGNKLTDDVLSATDAMHDVMGIVQHHDAVSGTARQRVADDYAFRISKVMDLNGKLYSDSINNEVLLLSGWDHSEPWEQCFRTNSTYLDCPTAKFVGGTVTNSDIAVHNPSTVDSHLISIPVPDGKYKARIFDNSTGKLNNVESEVSCFKDYAESLKNEITNCRLHIKALTKAHEVSYLNIEADVQGVAIHQEKAAKVGDKIDNDRFELEFGNFSPSSSDILLVLKDKKFNSTEQVTFSLRYWQSFITDNEQKSGDYIFRPLDDQYESYVYSNFSRATYMNGNLTQ